MRFLVLFISIFIIAWLIMSASCMTFRKSDVVMQQRFGKKNVRLLTGSIKLNGRNIHYAQTGADSLPTLVFFHGTPGSWDTFSGYMQDEELLNRYRMVSIDRPGFGFSDFGKPLNLEAQSFLLGPVLRQLSNDKPLFLVGHSLGGPLIVRVAAENPGLVSGLIMISASIDPALEKAEKWRPVLFRTPLNLLVPGAFRPSNVELWYLKKDLVELKPFYNTIRIPVYFIHGENDTWVPASNVDYGKALLKHAPVYTVILPKGNHFIPWTRFNEIKTFFLKLEQFR